MTCVLDASAMIAFLRDEPGADRVAEVLASPNDRCIAHALNFCEVYYDFHRAAGREEAVQAITDLTRLGIETHDTLTPDFWQSAGDLKSLHRRVSLADCFAIALANENEAELLTSDHHEFDILKSKGICRIKFIR